MFYSFLVNRIPFLMLFWAFCFFAPVQSEELGHVNITQLDEITVTASQSRFGLISPMPMQSLSGATLESLNSLSVADAIRYFSGAQLKDYGGVGGLKTVNIRSLGSAHTAVFYDGMLIGNAQNGQVDLGKFSLDNLEQIELYNGNKSTIFQPARGYFFANTLFLTSATPKFSGTKGNHFKSSLRVGSFGLINPAFLWQHRISEKASLSLSTEFQNAHGRYQYRETNGVYDTLITRKNGDINAFRAELGIHLVPNKKGKIALKTYLYDSERGLLGAAVANWENGINQYRQRQADQNFFIQASYQQAINETNEWLFNAKFAHDYTRYTDPDYGIDQGQTLDNRYYQSEYYLSALNLQRINSWWDVSIATDFVFNQLDANLTSFSAPTRSSLFATASSHIKFRRVDFQANLLTCVIKDQVQTGATGKRNQTIKPILSISYQPFHTPNFRIRSFYKQTFRMPSFNDLYYTFIGNSSLRPEKAIQYDFGFSWIRPLSGWFQRVSWQTDLFFNQLTDKIVAVPAQNQFRWTMQNLDKVEIKGVESNLELQSMLFNHTKIDFGINYTYQEATDRSKSSTTYKDQIPYTPKHSGTFHATIIQGAWQLNGSTIYTGKRYAQRANIASNLVQPWYTTDVAIQFNKICKAFKYRISGEINNVLNQQYEVVSMFPMPGRSFRISINTQF